MLWARASSSSWRNTFRGWEGLGRMRLTGSFVSFSLSLKTYAYLPFRGLFYHGGATAFVDSCRPVRIFYRYFLKPFTSSKPRAA